MAMAMRSVFVTVRSSPTIWTLPLSWAVMLDHAAKSSWSKGSSMETMGYSLAHLRYVASSSLDSTRVASGDLKVRL